MTLIFSPDTNPAKRKDSSNQPRRDYLPTAGGTYVLILCSQTMQCIIVGRLGELFLCPGFYVYVGSAFGAGGLAARVQRHLNPVHTLHWHIDYLRQATYPCEVWYTQDPVRHEHTWASILGEMPVSAVPLPGFGASDCTCTSHLFFFEFLPSFAAFQHAVAERTPGVSVLRWKFQHTPLDRAWSAPTPPQP